LFKIRSEFDRYRLQIGPSARLPEIEHGHRRVPPLLERKLIGLLGLGLVVVLFGFVLGKVGGDGDSAGG